MILFGNLSASISQIYNRTFFLMIFSFFLFFNKSVTQAEMISLPSKAPVDARGTFPMVPAYGYQDGFLLHRAETTSWGFFIQGMSSYMNHPFGQNSLLENRATLHAAAQVSFKDFGELGISIPFLIYQTSVTPSFAQQAVGDVSIYGKFIASKWTQKYIRLALAGQLQIDPGANDNSFFSGGKRPGGQFRFIIETPPAIKFLEIVSFYGNLGGFFSDDTRPCSSASDPGAITTPLTCNPNGKGFGNQFLYGIGTHINIKSRVRISSELVGSYSSFDEIGKRNPNLWANKIQYNDLGFTMSASYAWGFSSDAPTHTAFLNFGYNWSK